MRPTKWNPLSDQIDAYQVDPRSETSQVDALRSEIHQIEFNQVESTDSDQPTIVRPIKARPTKWNSLRSETNLVGPLKDQTESSQVEFTESDQPSGIKHTLVAATK